MRKNHRLLFFDRIFRLTFFVFGLFVFLSNGVLAQQDRPNIVFILSDDHAADAISAYGSQINQTPGIDQLAEEGMRFTNGFVVDSLCAPSRATILTGKYGKHNGVRKNKNPFDGSQTTFPKLVRKAGYQTALIGKWHLSSPPTGFDHWCILPGQGRYYDPVFRIKGEKRKTVDGFLTDIITDRSIQWLKQRDKDRPFMLMVHHKAPHGPVEDYDPKYKDHYTDDLPLPDTLFDRYNGRPGPQQAQGQYTWLTRMPRHDYSEAPPEKLTRNEKRRWMYQRYFKDYLRQVASLDDNVDRLVTFLDRHGMKENTIVIYTSDNGFFLGDHGWYNKMWMYEESLRVPLIVRWPGHVEPGTVNEEFVLNLDFAPTFTELSGASVPDQMQGRSFIPLLNGSTPEDWRSSMYYRYPKQYGVPFHEGVRTKRHKLIFYPNLEAWEAFDLQTDPSEVNNIVQDPDKKKTVRKLKRKLNRLRKRFWDSPG